MLVISSCGGLVVCIILSKNGELMVSELDSWFEKWLCAQWFVVLSISPINVGFLDLLKFLIRGLMVSYTILQIIFLGSVVPSMSGWFVDSWQMQAGSVCI